MTELLAARLPFLTHLGRSGEHRDVWFAIGIIFILTILFLPVPAWALDAGLSVSIALSVLILMVGLWINRPLDFSSFPTILLVSTMLRMALNIASTRLILSNGHEGQSAAGHVIEGFAQFVIGGNFVIGLIIFAILTTVNFFVITKGASRVAEVAARFTLDAIPGKQMAIDADLSAGLIDDKEAQRRRREVEEESSFFGAMDGASKFVRGDAIAGIIITFINLIGGMLIGVAQQGMAFSEAAHVYSTLSVGDGLVSQIPSLVVSLAAGMLVTKGGNKGSTDEAILRQLGGYPKALFVAAVLMGMFGLAPGLPMFPFFLLGGIFGFVAWWLPRHLARTEAERQRQELAAAQPKVSAETPIEELLRVEDIQLEVGSQLVPLIIGENTGLTAKVGLLRRRFAKQYGFYLPKIRVKDNGFLAPKAYEISIQSVVAGKGEIWPRYMLAIDPGGKAPPIDGQETREPTFGLPARWITRSAAEKAETLGYTVVDEESVVVTHLTEIIKENLSTLLTYSALQKLIDGLSAEYQKLVAELVPSQITKAALQNVLQSLLAEQVSVRNLPLILEAVAEAVPHSRNVNLIVEHVRVRLSQQICQTLVGEDGFISVVTLQPKWEQAFLSHIEQQGEDRVFTMPPSLVHDFVIAARSVIQDQLAHGNPFAIIVNQEARPFVRSLLERVSTSLPVLSHAELHRKTPVKTIAQI